MTIEKKERKRRTFTFDEVKQHASSLGGKCLSKIYVNSTYKMLFECKVAHRWKASTLDVLGKKNKPGTWCPRCPKSEG